MPGTWRWQDVMFALAVFMVILGYLNVVGLAAWAYWSLPWSIPYDDATAKRFLKSAEMLAGGIGASFAVWVGIKKTVAIAEVQGEKWLRYAAWIYFIISVLMIAGYSFAKPDLAFAEAGQAMEALVKTAWGSLVGLYVFAVAKPAGNAIRRLFGI
jgi:hypothetical protein